MRIAAVLMNASLLPVVVAPVVGAMQPSRAPLYAEWLRDQLPEAPRPAVEAALAEAAAGRAHSLESFVRAFAEAFEEQHPGLQLADVFPLEESSTEALLRYLYSRYGQMLGGVPIANATLESARLSLAGVQGRVAAILPDVSDASKVLVTGIAGPSLDRRCLVFPVRLTSSARPLGP